MSVDAEKSIIDQLQQNSRLSFGDLVARTEYRGHDVRRALKYLLENDDRVYVQGVEDKQKFYALRDDE